MPESRGVQTSSLRSAEDALSSDTLYRQAMAHYRRREWQQAREDLERLKAAEPGRRGIDAVLDELAIFIHLDALRATSTAGPFPTQRQLSVPALAAAARRHAPAILAGLALAAILALWGHHLITARAAGRVRVLQSLAPTLAAAGEWSQAIDAYEEWLLLTPGDAEARSGLWSAYYARGDQRAQAAQALEEEEEYARAAEQWEGALADFKAARQVAPDHAPDRRGAPEARISTAEKGRRCAVLLSEALALRSQRRWPEVIHALEAVQAEDAAYSSGRVAGYLGEAFLESGQEALAAARSPAEIQDAVRSIARAAQVQPNAPWAQMALWQAEHYLQGATSAQKHDWDAALLALEPLLKEPVDLTGGHARALLCQAQTARADQSYQAGRLLEALADYQAVMQRCSGDPWAQAQAQQITLSLTPAPLPKPTAVQVSAAASLP